MLLQLRSVVSDLKSVELPKFVQNYHFVTGCLVQMVTVMHIIVICCKKLWMNKGKSVDYLCSHV